MNSQKVVTILLPEGEPNGLKIVQLAGWVGETLVVPRARLSKFFERPEVQDPGIYFLFGENENSTKPIAYIGQSGNIADRIKTQAGDKDYWNVAVVFVGGLEGGDVKYLERRAFESARSADRCEIRNSQNPEGSKLSEAKKVSIEAYFENIEFLISTLGFAIFQGVPRQSEAEIFYCRGEGFDAKGTLLETGEFMVYKASAARLQERPAAYDYTKALRRKLEVEGVLVKRDDRSLVFDRNYIFTSPSSASEVIRATPSNGWTTWIASDGRTLDAVKRHTNKI